VDNAMCIVQELTTFLVILLLKMLNLWRNTLKIGIRLHTIQLMGIGHSLKFEVKKAKLETFEFRGES